ncbi:MAG: class I SAM-dependent rRNA methyltransferase [Bacillota bacterium]
MPNRGNVSGVVRLLPKMRHRVFYGHPWVFSNEIESVEGTYEPGDIVEVRDRRQRFVGLGFINPQSTIAVRILTREQRSINDEFFRERIAMAIGHRKLMYGVAGSLGDHPGGFRLAFSEADFLPGLVADIFGGYLAFQTLTLGIDRWKDTIVRALVDQVSPKGVYERNDAPVRRLEGLGLQSGYIGGSFDPLVEMDENGVRMLVDVQRGQKTGYFLDQTDNRLAVRRFCAGKTVLDAFCYSGGFGLSATKAGAQHVVFLDASQAALDLARATAERNGVLEKVSFHAGNAFDLLRQLDGTGARFDVVMLDPPAFARSRKMAERALAGYKEINLRAMRLVKEGGFLCTSSCSQHVTTQEFDGMLADAASDANSSVRIVVSQGQRADHPILAGVPETEYLKFRVCQVFKSI